MPISSDPATRAIRINGQGTPGGHVVCMHRSAQQNVLIALARDGRFRPEKVGTLTGLITDFRATAPVANTGSGDEAPSGTRRMFEDCVTGVITLGHIPLNTVTTVLLPRQHTAHLEGTFALCRRNRHIRECHGDLHPDNIVLIDGQPTPFDCLEFSPSL